MSTIASFYLFAVLVLSLFGLALMAFDKSRAGAGRRRVPERTFHLLAALGGWPGILLGVRCFRHKTRKLAFQIPLGAAIALHLAIVGAALYFRT